MTLHFTYKGRSTVLQSFTSFMIVKTNTTLNLGNSDKKLAVVVHVLPDNAEFGHFTFLFCRGRQRNVPRIITHVHSHFAAH